MCYTCIELCCILKRDGDESLCWSPLEKDIHFVINPSCERPLLKVAMLMPILLLQKPHFKSRSRDDARVLERHLRSWLTGDLDALLLECCSIQHHLPSLTPTVPSSGQLARRFAKLMMEGKLRAATRLIDTNAESFPLSLSTMVSVSGVDRSVKDILLEKHPRSLT